MARPPAVLRAAVQGQPRAVVQGQPRAVVVEAVPAVGVRRQRPPVPWRKLRMVIPTLAVFGTFRTRLRRASKGLMRRPAAVVAPVAVLAVAAVVAPAAAEPLARVPAEALLVAEVPLVVRWRSQVPMVVLLVVARRVAQVDRAALLLQLAAAVAAADGFLIHQTEKSRTPPKRELSSRTSSRITWPTNRS
jgi:hypothetical protein